MSTIRVSTVIAMVAALVLSAMPATAQDNRRGTADEQPQPRAERQRPRGDNPRQRNRGRQVESNRGPRDSATTAVPRQEAVPRDRVGPRSQDRDRDRGRDQARASRDRDRGRDRDRDRDQGRWVEPRRGSRDTWRNDRGRDYRYLPPSRVGRGYSRPSRIYVVPYGYRPRGYRPGWNVNLYFGRPYGYAGYNGGGYYGGGYYGSRNYGYYALPPGFAYGSVRIVDAPRRAQVFVDGYYAGEVDDYDGIFQRLNLEPGGHRIEIDVYPGAPPLEFEVYVEPGRTVTIHARP